MFHPSPPFQRCPKCSTAAALGTLGVEESSRQLRCKKCGYYECEVLEPVERKRVIYLDQYVMSNMMYALNPTTKSHLKANADPFWRNLFGELDRLMRTLRIVCPRSNVHRDESKVSPYPAPPERLHEHLSGEVEFHWTHQVEGNQVYRHVQEWLIGRGAQAQTVVLDDALEGNLTGWLPRITVSVDLGTLPGELEQVRENRQESADGLAHVFEGWQGHDKDFQEVFLTEARSYGPVFLRCLVNRAERREAIVRQGGPSTALELDTMLMGHHEHIWTCLEEGLRKGGVPGSEIAHNAIEYLLKGPLEWLPFNRISALLFAAIAGKAASGQKKPPGRGTSADVRAISVFLPYSDALFVDDQMRGLLSEKPVASRIDYPCKVFSTRTRDEFLGFLAALRSGTSEVHRQRVAEIYGENWEEPYFTILTPRTGSKASEREEPR